MNSLVKKEIRLLLPYFGFACVLALAGLFFPNNPDNFLNSIAYISSCVICPAAAVMLALSSFGVEVGSGTFSNMLAQPVSRMKLWETKFALLAFALLSVGFLWVASFLISMIHSGQNHGINDWLDLQATVTVTGLVIFSGGLWTVLLLRQVAAAFWFTLLVPGVILVLIMGLSADQSGEFTEGLIVSVLGLYSLAGIFFARWLFLRAQDVAWTGGNIVWPEMRGLKWWGERPREPQATLETDSRGRSPCCRWRPRAALFWKEMQLHQSQFVLAGVLVLLHLGVLAARRFGDFRKNSDTEFVLEIFWGLWLVMPPLVGAAAVAEERKLGTLAGQFCLPVKRRTQFAIKLSVALFLSVLLGAVIPLLLEGTRILPNAHSHFIDGLRQGAVLKAGAFQNLSTREMLYYRCLYEINAFLPLLTLAGIAAAFGAISFYASTLARNTLQALAPAVLGLVLIFFLNLMLVEPGSFGIHLPWRGSLIYFIGVPVLAATLGAMAFRNFQRPNLGWPAGLRNALVFAAALAFVGGTTAAVYHRVWEKLTPFEPAHGAARFTRANPPALINEWGAYSSVRLPDGRIWQDETSFYNSTANGLAQFLGDIRLTSVDGGRFLDGSNWLTVIRDGWQEQIGIKADGSLWVSETPRRVIQIKNGGWKIIAAGKLVRFGSETNWGSMIMDWPGLLLVKKDGTAWYWGSKNRKFENNKDWPGLRLFTPEPLGTETNWAEVFLANNQFCLRKTDGSVWIQWNGNHEEKTGREVDDSLGFSLECLPLSAHNQWRSTTSVRSGLGFQLSVCDDGTFRIWADEKFNRKSSYIEWATVDLQIGQDTNWLAVAGRGQKIVTLKDDGTLWLWTFYHDDRRGWETERDERALLAAKPTRLGTHSDWIAITDAQGGIVSLAADGSLWYWPLDSTDDFASEFGGSSPFWDDSGHTYFGPLLDIARKPQPLGNVFGQSN